MSLQALPKGKRARGITLVEFLFAAFTLLLFMLALYKITKGGLTSYKRGIIQSEIKQQVRTSMDKMVTDLRQADPSNPITPIGVYGPYSAALQTDMTFFRFKYVADNIRPVPGAGAVNVEYHLISENPAAVINGVSYNLGRLTRRERTGAAPWTTTTLCENVVITKAGVQKSGFRWIQNSTILNTGTGYDTPDGNKNVRVMEIMLMALRSDPSRNEPETVETSSQVAIRSFGMLASSNYYGVSDAMNTRSNVQRYGQPTSLVRP